MASGRGTLRIRDNPGEAEFLRVRVLVVLLVWFGVSVPLALLVGRALGGPELGAEDPSAVRVRPREGPGRENAGWTGEGGPPTPPGQRPFGRLSFPRPSALSDYFSSRRRRN